MWSQLPPSPQKGGTTLQFLVPVYCDQMAGWMKMPLGTEVDIGRGHIVLDGDPASPVKGAQQSLPPCFLPMAILATVTHISYCWALVVITMYLCDSVALGTELGFQRVCSNQSNKSWTRYCCLQFWVLIYWLYVIICIVCFQQETSNRWSYCKVIIDYF